MLPARLTWPGSPPLARISHTIVGRWRRALACQQDFAPPPIQGVFARCENLLARQGPSQRPRECEKCGLAVRRGVPDRPPGATTPTTGAAVARGITPRPTGFA